MSWLSPFSLRGDDRVAKPCDSQECYVCQDFRPGYVCKGLGRVAHWMCNLLAVLVFEFDANGEWCVHVSPLRLVRIPIRQCQLRYTR